MFKDIKAFLSSFFKRIKERSFFKKYLGIILAGILAILIPIIIAILYIEFKEVPTEETQADEISITIFDNEGNTINSEKTSLNNMDESSFSTIIYNIINTKKFIEKPEDFNKTPTFNLTVSNNDASLVYKCYFEKDPTDCFIEDGSGNFFIPQRKEYVSFLNSSFSQIIYPESIPPSLTIDNGTFVSPSTVNWSYKLTDGSVHSSTNFETADKSKSYMINGAINFMFSEAPTECNIQIKSKDGKLFFEGTLEETSDFTANDGDTFTVIINASWTDEKEKLSFGKQSYEFNIVCTKPSTIEITHETAFGGSLVKISISDVNNTDTVIYTAKEPQTENATLTALYNFVPSFKKSGQNAYAYLPIPTNVDEGTFEFSVSYGITKTDFAISLTKSSSPTVINLSADDISFNFTDKIKTDFAKMVFDISSASNEMILFTSEFLSPEEYGFNKSVEYNSDVLINKENSFKFLANSYISTSDSHLTVKSANVGTVKAVGFSELLGNYVAIDHGAGLYTWYCGLSDVSVFKGDILNKGEFIGRSGSTSLLCKNGVNIFCTLYGNLIDPSDVLGKKLV